jgi:alpha-galactosidase
MCNWGEDFPWNWGPTIANSWRITGDIYDSWDLPDARCPCDGDEAWNCQLPGFRCSVTNIMNKASFVASKAHPGGWNDLDMLEVGNGAMTDAEYVAHFSMCKSIHTPSLPSFNHCFFLIGAAAKSPLIMGNDIRVMKPADLSILSNAAIIAVNQDPLGSSAIRRWIWNTEDTDENFRATIQMWSGSLKSTTGGEVNDVVVLLINGGKSTREMNATLAEIFVDNGPRGTAKEAKMAWEVRDLWANRMSAEEASWIIGNGTATSSTTTGSDAATDRYNATKTSYAQGLANLDEELLGKVTTTVIPWGTITATVDPHGARAFRLRAVQGSDVVMEL